MLRRNIDTTSGLVNGAIGTVRKITKSCVRVQFDHMSSPYDVEVVASKFMLMKSFYVYRRQFPLIPAAAITIHKSQGLSLDSCMVDLSVMVFGAGMAYVALSRVRSLSGLHLVKFSPKSVTVSRKCLNEFNRLRQLFRPDIPLYIVPPPVVQLESLYCVLVSQTINRRNSLAVKQGVDNQTNPLQKEQSNRCQA